MANLVVESGADKRKIFALTGKPKFVCGRSPKADIVINDPFASSQHFGLLYKDGYWYIQDLKSSNGVELNEERITSSKLTDNDIIHVGSTYLRFVDPEDAADETDQPGRKLPKVTGYDVLDRLGIGGMGEVFRAKQVSLDREVALKILFKQHTRDKEFVQKFFQEARAAGNLNHPNIVQVHDVGDDNGVCFICMEYVSGGNLTDLLRKHGTLDQATTIRVAIEVARGLAYAKSKNLVHCDIKPDNIMFTESGMAKIADLGIARHTSEQQTQQKEVLGSPHYMAPEQAMGKPVDHRADLYALGCTMFRMLAGRTPFSGTSAREVMKKQVMEEHPDILKFAPDISPELADVIDALMEKNPDKRIQSANELIAMLEKIDRGEVGPRKPQPGALGRRPTTNVRRASNTLSGPAVTLRNTKISPVTTGAHAIGGARSRRGGGNGSLVSFAIFLAIVAVAALFVYRMAIDYKPKTALGQARSLSKYAAEAHKGGELEKARLNWDKALQLLADAGEASDPLLREEIETLRVDMEKQVEAVKKQEDAELERDRVNGMFDTAWKAYAKKRDARGKHKPSKEALLQELARMEQQFAGHPDKLKEIRLEKDIIGRQ